MGLGYCYTNTIEYHNSACHHKYNNASYEYNNKYYDEHDNEHYNNKHYDYAYHSRTYQQAAGVFPFGVKFSSKFRAKFESSNGAPSRD